MSRWDELGAATRYALVQEYPLFLEDRAARLDTIMATVRPGIQLTTEEAADPSFTPVDLVRLWAFNLEASEQAELVVLLTLGLAHLALRSFPWQPEHPDDLPLSAWTSACEPLLTHLYLRDSQSLLTMTRALAQTCQQIAQSDLLPVLLEPSEVFSVETLAVFTQLTPAVPADGRILRSALVHGGQGFRAGDYFQLPGGTTLALGRVDTLLMTSVQASWPFATTSTVSGYHLLQFGSGYEALAGSTIAVQPLTGQGSGLAIRLEAVGSLSPCQGYALPTLGLYGRYIPGALPPPPVASGFGAFLVASQDIGLYSVAAALDVVEDFHALGSFTTPSEMGSGGFSILLETLTPGYPFAAFTIGPQGNAITVTGVVQTGLTAVLTGTLWFTDNYGQESNHAAWSVEVFGG